MKILLILDPLPTLKIYKDSSYAILREAASRQHEIYVAQVDDLAVHSGQAQAQTQRLHLTGSTDDWYQLEAPVTTPLTQFDAVLMRKDPPFDMEYLYATHVLQHAARAGAKVFNHPQAIRDHNEKLAILEFPQFTAPTLVARRQATLKAFIAEQGDVVLKPLDGMGGSRIFRVRQDDPNLNVILETLTELEQQTIMAQRYLPEIKDGD